MGFSGHPNYKALICKLYVFIDKRFVTHPNHNPLVCIFVCLYRQTYR